MRTILFTRLMTSASVPWGSKLPPYRKPPPGSAARGLLQSILPVQRMLQAPESRRLIGWPSRQDGQDSTRGGVDNPRLPSVL